MENKRNREGIVMSYDERTGNMTSRSDVVRHQRETIEYNAFGKADHLTDDDNLI